MPGSRDQLKCLDPDIQRRGRPCGCPGRFPTTASLCRIPANCGPKGFGTGRYVTSGRGRLSAAREAVSLLVGSSDQVVQQFAGMIGGLAEACSGNHCLAFPLFQGALSRATELALPPRQLVCCQYVAVALARQGKVKHAARLWAACDSWLHSGSLAIKPLEVKLDGRAGLM
jgi:hypothetical protein